MSSLGDLFPAPVRRPVGNLVRKLMDPRFRGYYRQVYRLRNLQRYQGADTAVMGYPVRIIDRSSFLSAYKQIFRQEIYRFHSASGAPRIIDGGANIGLAVLFWKILYPGANIIAFEADPRVFDVLRFNCRKWGFEDVRLVHGALSDSGGEVLFRSDGADAGRVIDRDSEVAGGERRVPAVRLAEYLTESVDLLKLDIEGGEVAVLKDSVSHLDRVENLFVEYHSFVNVPQEFDVLLTLMRRAGFRVHVQPELVSPRPFLDKLNDYGMDQRLNIYGYRPGR